MLSIKRFSRLEYRYWLVVRLKAIKCYEKFLCYLSFLLIPSSFFNYLVLFVIRFLYVRLIKVMRHRHFSWNPNNLIWSKANLKNLYPCLAQTALLSGKIFQRARPTMFNKLYVLLYSRFVDQKDCSFQYFCNFSYLLCKAPNRSDALFYHLIFYDKPYLYKLLNRLGGLFYPLVLSQLIYLLHELPNMLGGIFYPLVLLQLAQLQITK